jgi:hypothetical protein
MVQHAAEAAATAVFAIYYGKLNAIRLLAVAGAPYSRKAKSVAKKYQDANLIHYRGASLLRDRARGSLLHG